MEIPKNLEECYIELEKLEDIESWLKKSENEAWQVGMGMDVQFPFPAVAHHGIGMWIRNNWGLWKSEGELFNWFKENEINHPDDMSGIILKSFYRHKNNLDIELYEQIEHSVEYYLTEQERLVRQRKKKLNKIEDAD